MFGKEGKFRSFFSEIVVLDLGSRGFAMNEDLRYRFVVCQRGVKPLLLGASFVAAETL